MNDPSLRDLFSAETRALRDLIDERDRRYEERAEAAARAVGAALAAAEKAGEKTEQALKEYKTASNEWRDTVKDLVSRMPTRAEVENMFRNTDEKINRLDADVRGLRESRSQLGGDREGGQAVKDESRANLALVAGFIGALIGIAGALVAVLK